jgi:hypothetical protein
MSKPSQIVSKVLSPALGLLLRSQVQQVEELQIQIQGQDRQILKGYIPSVFLNSRRAVYQGLHLGHLQIRGENIRINIGQVLKGKPLRLLENIQVTGEIKIEASDIQASVSSSILANALTDLLLTLLEVQELADPDHFAQTYQVNWQTINLHTDQFTLRGTVCDRQGNSHPIHLQANLELANPQTLQMASVYLEGLPQFSPLSLREFTVNLGTDVELEALKLEADRILCSGRFLVRA